jgi:hypothetical protein
MNPFYTHQEVLNKILESFDYSKSVHCLEFGSGEGSSSIFYKFAKSYSNLSVDCFEHEEDWMDNMSKKYKLENYNFNLVNWSNINYDELKIKKYDLIFVDQGNWNARIETIDKLMNYSKYIILHDYCYYNGFTPEIGYNPDSNYNNFGKGSFFEKYNEEFSISSFTDLYPPTLIFKSKKLF